MDATAELIRAMLDADSDDEKRAPPGAAAAPPVSPVAAAAPEPRARRAGRAPGTGRLAAAMRRAADNKREADGAVPTDGAAWGAAVHQLNCARLLTVDDPRAPDPPGFKGTLYGPQKTLLAAMVALERRPLLRVAGAPREMTIQTKVARVSERFSAGKTVVALALVCAQRVPARLPELAPLATMCPPFSPQQTAGLAADRARVTTGPGGTFGDHGFRVFRPEVSVRYSRYLPLTVVAAASNVISQWQENARRFTALRFFTIEHVRDLREFEACYRKTGANQYDLVFLKAGRVTANFLAAGEAKRAGEAPRANRSLFEALARVLDGVPVARLIVDDYDTLRLNRDDCYPPALFTWLVSATRRQVATKLVATGATHCTPADFLRAQLGAPIGAAAADDVINKIFTLHCDPAYLDANVACGYRPAFRRVFVAGGRAAGILRDLGVRADVVEMVNADAVGAAAAAVGAEARTPAELVRHVVGARLDEYRHAVGALARAGRARAALAARHGPPADAAAASTMRALLKAPVGRFAGALDEVEAALAGVTGRSRETDAALASLEEWAAGARDRCGQTLARMRDNIRERRCQCCMVRFGGGGGGEGGEAAKQGGEAAKQVGEGAEAAYVLAGCCQIIVCETCVRRRQAGGSRRCPNCARDVRAAELIRVGAELDLDAALQDRVVFGDGAAPEAAPEATPNAAPGAVSGAAPEAVPGAAPEAVPNAVPNAAPGAVAPDAAPDSPKINALVQFLRGEAIDCLRDVTVPPYVTGLLAGAQDAPWPADQPRRILVFAVYPETTALLARALTQAQVPYCMLRGTRAQKDEAVRRLREEVSVMLVTAAGDCGGLHLPFLSHVVFYHRVLDTNVEAQVAARGQRLGRTHSLEIVTFVNEGEDDGL